MPGDAVACACGHGPSRRKGGLRSPASGVVPFLGVFKEPILPCWTGREGRGFDGGSLVEIGRSCVVVRGGGTGFDDVLAGPHAGVCAKRRDVQIRSRSHRVSAYRHASKRAVRVVSHQRPLQDHADGMFRLP